MARAPMVNVWAAEVEAPLLTVTQIGPNETRVRSGSHGHGKVIWICCQATGADTQGHERITTRRSKNAAPGDRREYRGIGGPSPRSLESHGAVGGCRGSQIRSAVR